jgi:hypothetical protein
MFKALERFTLEKDGTVKTAVDTVEYIYHLSPTKGIDVLKPRTNQNSERGGKKENNRVCFGDGVHCCVQAMFLPGWIRNFSYSGDDSMIHLNNARIEPRTFRFHVYRAKVSSLDPSKVVAYELDKVRSFTKVFDQLLTGEVGYAGPVPVEYVGAVDIHMLTRPDHMKMRKYPFLYYWINPLSALQHPELFHHFVVKCAGPGKEYTLNEVDLSHHEDTLEKRGEIIRHELQKKTREISEKVALYYNTGVPVNPV